MPGTRKRLTQASSPSPSPATRKHARVTSRRSEPHASPSDELPLVPSQTTSEVKTTDDTYELILSVVRNRNGHSFLHVLEGSTGAKSTLDAVNDLLEEIQERAEEMGEVTAALLAYAKEKKIWQQHHAVKMRNEKIWFDDVLSRHNTLKPLLNASSDGLVKKARYCRQINQAWGEDWLRRLGQAKPKPLEGWDHWKEEQAIGPVVLEHIAKYSHTRSLPDAVRDWNQMIAERKSKRPGSAGFVGAWLQVGDVKNALEKLQGGHGAGTVAATPRSSAAGPAIRVDAGPVSRTPVVRNAVQDKTVAQKPVRKESRAQPMHSKTRPVSTDPVTGDNDEEDGEHEDDEGAENDVAGGLTAASHETTGGVTRQAEAPPTVEAHHFLHGDDDTKLVAQVQALLQRRIIMAESRACCRRCAASVRKENDSIAASAGSWWGLTSSESADEE